MFEIIALLLLWGSAVEPRLILDVQHESAELPALTAEWEGERVAVFADWQIGTWLNNRGMVEKAVERILEERPVAVLFAGDFLTRPDVETDEKIRATVRLMRPIPESGITTFAVLGNHDFALASPDEEPVERPARRLIARLEEVGVHVLQNRAVPLFHPRQPAGGLYAWLLSTPLYMVGLGSEYAGNDDPVAALQDVPFHSPRIVLMHHPDSFRRLPGWSAPLAVAGHRHGGQFRLPLINVSWLRLRGTHAEGWAPEGFGAPGNTLYVTRGIGMSVVPIRLNAPPELTFLTLTRAGGAER